MSNRTKRSPAARFLGALLVALGRALAAPFLGALYLLRPRVPARTIIELDLEEGLLEHVPEDPLAALQARKRVVIRDVVDALHVAAGDRRVVGLVARVGGGPIGIAHVEEIRDAVAELRRRGKHTVLFSETFGEGGPGHTGYYLATAFDEVYLQPSGDVGLTGLLVEHPFLRGTLEKVGVEPRLDHRHEYKTAKNLFTEDRFTKEHRESTEELLESIFGRIVEAIAYGRGLTPEEVREKIAQGPFSGEEAVEAGLVDGLAYRDEVYQRLRDRFEKAGFLYHSVYLHRAGRPNRLGPSIALIYGTGAVRRGESTYSPGMRSFGGTSLGSKTVAGAFRKAIDDDRVKAIIFRVDSPGGSYVASDSIWRETIRAREAGKPVIVSMSNVAASGGYFVAANAAKIVAQPSTLTGSIGVVAGKAVMRGLWDKLGVTWDAVHVGGRSTMYSTVQDYTPEDWARLQASLDRIYEDFTAKVAAGRGLTREKVDEVARGRVWTGADAQRLGLVDELGGLTTALRLAREAAGIAPDADIRLKELPERKTLLDRFRRGRPTSSENTAALLGLSVLERLEPLLEQSRHLGLLGDIGELEIPEMRIR
jgi:protease IV